MHENYDEALLLELVKNKQFRALRAHLDEMNEVDIAEFLDELEPDQQVVVFHCCPRTWPPTCSPIWRTARIRRRSSTP